MQKNHICMWGDITEDRDYYDFHLNSLFSKLSNKNLNLHEKKSNSVYGFYLCNPKTIELFNKTFNFPIGKKTYTVEVPNIILKSKNYKIYASFIRGYADCDGCINFFRRGKGYKKFKRKFNTYPRVSIISTSKTIIYQIGYMLEKIGIKHTIHKQKRVRKTKLILILLL